LNTTGCYLLEGAITDVVLLNGHPVILRDAKRLSGHCV